MTENGGFGIKFLIAEASNSFYSRCVMGLPSFSTLSYDLSLFVYNNTFGLKALEAFRYHVVHSARRKKHRHHAAVDLENNRST